MRHLGMHAASAMKECRHTAGLGTRIRHAAITPCTRRKPRTQAGQYATAAAAEKGGRERRESRRMKAELVAPRQSV
jgi:hypothetical protein